MALSRDSRPIEWVTEDIIREIFNESQLYENTMTGKVVTTIRRNKHREPPPEGEPLCTRSQILSYSLPDGELLAVVHQYLRPDGTIGGSGLPDPKRLYLADKIFSLERPRKEGHD